MNILFRLLRMNLILIWEVTLNGLISKMGYSSYCQLVLWWNLNFLHDIRASYPTCEVKRPHTLHVIPLCCPRIRFENSPHMKKCVKNESHIDGRTILHHLLRHGHENCMCAYTERTKRSTSTSLKINHVFFWNNLSSLSDDVSKSDSRECWRHSTCKELDA